MKSLLSTAGLLAALVSGVWAAPTDHSVFDSVESLWAGFDPRAAAIEAEVLNEKVVDGVVVRTVRYTAEEVDGFKVRVVGYYGFPVGHKKLPGILHVHGGGQNAMTPYVEFWGRRGYATLSINWGGRPLEGNPANPRTEWGPLRYNQDPDDDDHLYTLHPDARHNSWFHWAIAARRGITFLEQQPEVDPDRLGEFGISMGGMITWLVAGTDTRLKCVADIFGLELLHEALPGKPGSEYALPLRDQPLWPNVLDPIAYAPRIRAPFLFLSGTNDVHARMDMVDRTLRAIPSPNVWQTYSLHLSHASTPREARSLELWMARWLKDGAAWPRSPQLKLNLDRRGHDLEANVTIEHDGHARERLVHYSTDPYPAGRFWRTVVAEPAVGGWTTRLPLLRTDQTIYAFADVAYESGIVIASPLATVTPAALQAAGIAATQRPTRLIDDFRRGGTDWYNPDGGANVALSERVSFRRVADGLTWQEPMRNGWRFFTRKIADLAWAPPPGAALSITLRAERPNSFVIVVVRDDARPPKTPRYYSASVAVNGGGAPEACVARLSDFHAVDGNEALTDWSDVNVLGIASRYVVSGKRVRMPDRELGGAWNGPAATLVRVQWVDSAR